MFEVLVSYHSFIEITDQQFTRLSLKGLICHVIKIYSQMISF